MSDLFISYRRQDAAAHAGRLYDALAQRYGNDRVVFDVVDLALGQDFAQQLHDAVAACKCVLVVIGPQWVTATDANGRRRIDEPDDFIRSEVAAALRAKKYVVPILVGGAVMPSAAELPQDLQAIARRQAAALNDATWDRDLRELYRVLDPLMHAQGDSASMVSPAAPQSAARHSFMSRVLAAIDVLTGRSGTESKDQSAGVAPPRPSPAVRPSTRSKKPVPPAPRAAAARKQVFVSYAEEDQPLADDVVRLLEERGHACWIAHRNIPPGTQSWAGPIVAAIANSRVVLILVTTYSVASKQVLREVTVADDENIPLIPACIDKVPLSEDFRYFFSSPQRLELDDLPHDQVVQQIGSAVERHLTQS